MLAYLAVRFGISLNQLLRRKISSHWQAFDRLNNQHSHLAAAVLFSGMVIAGLALLILLFILISRFDPRMQEMFNFNLASENPLLDYANS